MQRNMVALNFFLVTLLLNRRLNFDPLTCGLPGLRVRVPFSQFMVLLDSLGRFVVAVA